MRLQEASALVALGAAAADGAPGAAQASAFLLRLLGAAPGVARGALPELVPLGVAATLLQLFEAPPPGVAPHDVAAALAPDGAAGGAQGASLDALVGVACLLAGGGTADKLRWAFWALDRDGSGALSLGELLALLRALPLAARAAALLLGQATPGGLAARRARPREAAAAARRLELLEGVLRRGFVDAVGTPTGLLHPGPQAEQLLFSVAAQLTALLVSAEEPAAGGAGPAGAAGSDGSGSDDGASSDGGSGASSDGGAGGARPSPWAAAGPPPPLQQQQPYPQHHQQGPAGGAPGAATADVVVVDGAGGVLLYTASVEDAAAAAAAGRPPPRWFGGAAAGGDVRVWQRHGGPDAAQRLLSPASSLTRQLSERGVQLQQLHSATASEVAAAQFYSPLPSSTGEGAGPPPGTGGAGGEGGAPQAQQPVQRLRSASSKRRLAESGVAAGRLLAAKLRRATAEHGAGDGAAAPELPPPRPGAGPGPGASGPPAGGAAPSTAITTTAASVMDSVQRGVAAASVRVLSLCSICFLLTTCVALGDAALVTGLVRGARLGLPAALAIAVGANAALGLALVAALVAARCAAGARPLAETLNGPEGQAVDAALANISTAIAALKNSDAQRAGAAAPAGAPGRAGGTPRRSSGGDLEAGGGPGAAAGGSAAFAGRLRTLWSTVGQMAGFLPPAVQEGGLTESGSLQLGSGLSARQATLSAGSGDGGGLQPGGGGGGGGGPAPRPAAAAHGATPPPGRGARAHGSAAPALGGGAGPGEARISLKDAYPAL
ncbi:hypothetical protein HT031_006175 [Scenedesmus sp. PABB004]|nr:hypothetical protein HT031_006175 [Scenedesmus sp. PABB004]